MSRRRHASRLAVATAVLTGATLTFDLLESETAFHAEQWIRDLAHTIGAQVIVTDDADGLKTVADDLAVQHQICRAHVNRNFHLSATTKPSIIVAEAIYPRERQNFGMEIIETTIPAHILRQIAEEVKNA